MNKDTLHWKEIQSGSIKKITVISVPYYISILHSYYDTTNPLRVTITFYYRAVEGFSNAELSSAVASDLFGNLDQVFNSSENWIEKKFAVRSSAVGEDSSDLSSAGQNETFLGCSGKSRIEEAVLKCWASLFAFQSVEYRRYNEISFFEQITKFAHLNEVQSSKFNKNRKFEITKLEIFFFAL